MNLTVVLVNFNTTKDTLECLKSLKKASVPKGMNVEIVVVDNGSKPEFTQELQTKISQEIVFIKVAQNTGFAGGNNIGIKKSLSDNATHILLLNNDTEVPPTFFSNIFKCAINDVGVGIISPKIYFAKGYEFHKERYKNSEKGKVIWSAGGVIDWNNVLASNDHVDEVDNGQLKKASETDFATGACLLTKKEVFEKIGLINEDYFLYLEDLEFSLRAKKAGYKIIFDPSVYLWHKVSQSSGIGSSLNDYFITRNRLMFAMTYANFRAKFAVLREAIRLLLSGRPGQKAGVKDFFSGNFGKGSWLK